MPHVVTLRRCAVMGCTCAHHLAQLEDVDRFVDFRPSTVDNGRVARATCRCDMKYAS